VPDNADHDLATRLLGEEEEPAPEKLIEKCGLARQGPRPVAQKVRREVSDGQEDRKEARLVWAERPHRAECCVAGARTSIACSSRKW
jgi:hypothetical protein